MGEETANAREPTKDCRGELIDQISMYLISCGIDAAEAKNNLYILTEPYEITSHCTELSELHEDRNQAMLKKFLIAKTVKGCSERTLTQYGTQLKCILERINKRVEDITAEDIRYYLALRQRRDHITKTTADNERRYLKTFFEFLATEELIPKNPMAKVDRIKCEKKKKAAFTDMEIEKIRMAASDERERAIIETLLSTGCRVTELVQIKTGEIEGGRVLIHGKGAKDRYVYLNAKATLAIEEYQKMRNSSSQYLFTQKRGNKTTHISRGTVERMMHEIANKAGVEQANPHKFRRTCATVALRRGMPLEQVSKMLGHEELSTTQIYLDLTEEDLAQAHKKYVV